ncbi:hypothetical protein LZ30DRAFT_696994 [Colletotrichum cereale]|nr:hypothetical protein LZ30DRAFT_696994 [Colletotrichum cereale]
MSQAGKLKSQSRVARRHQPTGWMEDATAACSSSGAPCLGPVPSPGALAAYTDYGALRCSLLVCFFWPKKMSFKSTKSDKPAWVVDEETSQVQGRLCMCCYRPVLTGSNTDGTQSASARHSGLDQCWTGVECGTRKQRRRAARQTMGKASGWLADTFNLSHKSSGIPLEEWTGLVAWALECVGNGPDGRGRMVRRQRNVGRWIILYNPGSRYSCASRSGIPLGARRTCARYSTC